MSAYHAKQPIHQLGSTEYGNVSVSASAVTILAPGSNTKGTWLRTLLPLALSSSAGVSVYIGTSAPTALHDANLARIACAFELTGYSVPLPFFVPAGYGIYAFGGAGNGYLHLSYDVLS